MEHSSESKNRTDSSFSGMEIIEVKSGDASMNLSDNNRAGEVKKIEKKDAAVQVNCRLIKIADFPAYCESESQHGTGRKVQSALFLNEMGSIAKFHKLSGPVLVHGDRIRKRSAMLTFSQMRDLMSQAEHDASGDTTLEVSDDTNRHGDTAVVAKNDDKHSSVEVPAPHQMSGPLKCKFDQLKELMSQARELGVMKVETEATSSDFETVHKNEQNRYDFNSGVRVSRGCSLGGSIAEALRQCEMVLPEYSGHSVEMTVPDYGSRAGGKGSSKTGDTSSNSSSRAGDSGRDKRYDKSSAFDGSGNDDDDVKVIDGDDDDFMPTTEVALTSRRMISSTEEENENEKKTRSDSPQWVRRSARERIKCSHCDRMFTNQNQCRAHETEHVLAVVSCAACPMEFPNEEELIKHAQAVHLQSPKISRLKEGPETRTSTMKSPSVHSKVLQFRSETETMTSKKDLRQSVASGLKRVNPDQGDMAEQCPSKRVLRTMLKCCDCVKVFKSLADLDAHRKMMHLLQSHEKGPKIPMTTEGQPEKDQLSNLNSNKPNLLSVTPKVQSSSSTPKVESSAQKVLSSTPKVQLSASTAPLVHPVKPMMQSIKVSTEKSNVKQSGGIKCSKCSWVFFDREKLHEHEAKVHKIANPTKDDGRKENDVQKEQKADEKSDTNKRNEIRSVGIEKRNKGRQREVTHDSDSTSTDTDGDLDTDARSSSSSEKLPISSRSKREMKQCPHCHLRISCPESLKKHVAGHLSGYCCGSCDFVCKTERSLRTHFRHKHGEQTVKRQETDVSADKDDDEKEDVASADGSDDASYKSEQPRKPTLKVSRNLFKKRPHNDSPSATGTDDSNIE